MRYTSIVLVLLVACGGSAEPEPCAPPPPAPDRVEPEPAAAACDSVRFYLADPYVYDRERGNRIWYRAAAAGETPDEACLGASLGGARPATAEEIRELRVSVSCALPAPFVVEPGQIATSTGCIELETGREVTCTGWWRRSLCLAGGPTK